MRTISSIPLYMLSFFMFSLPATADTRITFDVGAQADYLQWNISGQNGTPNILSELTFYTLSPMGRLTFYSQPGASPFWFTLQYAKGVAIDGDVTDQDFILNDRQGLFSSTEHETADSDIQSAYLRLGYGRSKEQGFSFRPTIGAQWQSADMKIKKGRQLLCTIPNCPSNSEANNIFATALDSNYKANWLALSVGAVLEYQLQDKPLKFIVDANLFPYARYEAKGFWNLRALSFEHTGDGLGGALTAQAQWLLGQRWLLGLGWQGQLFYLEDGETTNNGAESVALREVLHATSLLFLNLSYQWR